MLAQVTATPVDEIVHQLEVALTAARAGVIRSLVMVFEHRDPCETDYSVAWEDGAPLQMLLGELERVKLVLLLKMIEESGAKEGEPGGTG
jgi:hypothetical protein